MEDDGNGGQRERSERCKAKRKIAHYKQPIFPIPQGTLMPGTFNIAFRFVLPDIMPSSIYFKDKRRRENPKAKIKYFIKAILKTDMFSDNMKYK